MSDTKEFKTEKGVEPALAPRQRLSPSAADLLSERHGSLPVWIRPPKQGTEHFTGLARTTLYELASRGLIKTASLREPGKVRGVRLFLLSSILEYIGRNQVQPTAGHSNPNYQEHSIKS